MKVLTSPQVGIAAMRQLGSRIIVYISVAAQALQVSAAALEGALPMSIVFSNDSGDSVSLLLEDFVAGLFVGIAAMRQLGSCNIVYTSVAAQALQVSAAALEGALPMTIVFSNDSGDSVSLLLEDFVAGLFVGIAAIRQHGSCNTVDSSAALQAVEIAVAALEGSLPLPFGFSNGFFWVFILGLGVLLTLEGYLSGSGAARCVSLTLRVRGLLQRGHVLGLRVLCRCDITSMSQRGVRRLFEDALAVTLPTPRLSGSTGLVPTTPSPLVVITALARSVQARHHGWTWTR